MTCRHCKLYQIETAQDKAGRVHKDWAAPCLWESAEVYPLSVWRPNNNRPKPGYMTPLQGDKCPCFIQREEA